MGAGGFHGRVRDGIGCGLPAMATRSSSLSGMDGAVRGFGAVCGIAGMIGVYAWWGWVVVDLKFYRVISTG